MSAATHVANSPALVAGHQGQVAAEARHQDRQERESEPTPQPVAVAVGAVARVDVVPLGVGHAVVEETLGTLEAGRRFDSRPEAVDRRVGAAAALVALGREGGPAVHACQQHRRPALCRQRRGLLVDRRQQQLAAAAVVQRYRRPALAAAAADFGRTTQTRVKITGALTARPAADDHFPGIAAAAVGLLDRLLEAGPSAARLGALVDGAVGIHKLGVGVFVGRLPPGELDVGVVLVFLVQVVAHDAVELVGRKQEVRFLVSGVELLEEELGSRQRRRGNEVEAELQL